MANMDISETTATTPVEIESMEQLSEEWLPPRRTKTRMTAILIALYLSLFIAALDQTIVATSIPTITSTLRSASGYVWIGGAYLLAFAAASPIWAKISDIWGRKPAILGAVALFGGASVLAALSTSMRMLIVGRALQGTAGGGIIQLVTIVISDLFSMRQRALFLGLLEVMWAVAGGAGPLIGGAFTQLLTWRWCFWISLPFCGTAFVLLLIFLDVHNPRTRLYDGIKAVDWYGMFSILGVTLMLLIGLNFGGVTFAWNSATVICLIVFGTLMIGVFIFSEKRLAKYPLMPMTIFSQRSTNAAFMVSFIHGLVYISASYYLPLYLQSVKEASPLRSGVLVLPLVVPEAIAGILAGVLIHQTGRYREIMWAGTALLTLGIGLFIHFNASTSIAEIVGFEIVSGFGSGLLFEAPLIAVQVMARQNDVATATSSISFIRNIATSMSLVIGGVIFSNGMDARVTQLSKAGLDSATANLFSGDQAAANVEIIKTIQNMSERFAVKQAFAGSLRNMWIMFASIAAVGVVASAFLSHKDLSEEHTETRTGLLEKTEASYPAL